MKAVLLNYGTDISEHMLEDMLSRGLTPVCVTGAFIGDEILIKAQTLAEKHNVRQDSIIFDTFPELKNAYLSPPHNEFNSLAMMMCASSIILWQELETSNVIRCGTKLSQETMNWAISAFMNHPSGKYKFIGGK